MEGTLTKRSRCGRINGEKAKMGIEVCTPDRNRTLLHHCVTGTILVNKRGEPAGKDRFRYSILQ